MRWTARKKGRNEKEGRRKEEKRKGKEKEEKEGRKEKEETKGTVRIGGASDRNGEIDRQIKQESEN